MQPTHRLTTTPAVKLPPIARITALVNSECSDDDPKTKCVLLDFANIWGNYRVSANEFVQKLRDIINRHNLNCDEKRHTLEFVKNTFLEQLVHNPFFREAVIARLEAQDQ